MLMQRVQLPTNLIGSSHVPVGTGSRSGQEEVVDLEIALLLEGLYSKFGYDFRDYAPNSLKRRIIEAQLQEGLDSVSQLQDRVFRDRRVWERLFLKLSVNVTSFFRDPAFFKALRTRIIPQLSELGFLRIWHAGCATGEEVYSTAIVLHEEGLLDRCRIYATDINEAVLRTGKSGIYHRDQLEEAERAYLQSGGKASFASYTKKKYDNFIIDRSFAKHVHFAEHNLVTDGVFNQFDLIIARNVLIYFNQDLQDNVNTLIYNSLAPGGFVGVGERENMRYTVHEHDYQEQPVEGKVYSCFYRKAQTELAIQ